MVKRKRYSIEQIVAAVKQHGLGNWRRILRGNSVTPSRHFIAGRSSTVGSSRARDLMQPSEANAKLKQVVADLSLDKAMLTDIAKKKW